MRDYVNWERMKHWHASKPMLSVYLEFCCRERQEILDLGEFEAMRRWLLSRPKCFSVPITQETSLKVTRDFFKNLRHEQKEIQHNLQLARSSRLLGRMGKE